MSAVILDQSSWLNLETLTHLMLCDLHDHKGSLLHWKTLKLQSGSVGFDLARNCWRISNSLMVVLQSVYAPTLQADPAEKDKFYTDLCRLTQKVPADDKIIILGDFNTRVAWIDLESCPDPEQHLALGLIKLLEIPMGPLPELVQVPLNGILSFRHDNHTTQLGVICKCAEEPFVYANKEDFK
ncbi:hypothetical protein WISP_22947 [Willisornis vidua]|uniref:Endonuclease/exonuclease/phosphatase domain-containing protein n=1 Tax=Willisornis vidua TaxID=1566151 RepID=A0ABQ9DNA5_9PASS|nr:hypothetical protein WISP_22947 [Willisornis vidua]